MQSRTKVLFVLIILIISFFAVRVSAVGCDVSVTPTVVEVVDGTDPTVNTAKVTVSGQGSASGFSEATRVEVNCNIYGTKPGAEEDVVRATISTYTPTELSYTDAICVYKSSERDVDYKVSATIKLDDIVCTGGFCFSTISCSNKETDSYAVVTVKASTQESKQQDEIVPMSNEQCGSLNQAPCTACPSGSICSSGCLEPYVKKNGLCLACDPGYVYSGGAGRVALCLKCGGELLFACGAPAPNGKTCDPGLTVDSSGRCFKQTNTDQTNTGQTTVEQTSSEREMRFGLDWKWSLIGVPYGEISSEDHACLSKIYYYDKTQRKYQKVTDLKDKNLIGKGLWAMRPAKGVGGCTIKYTGKFLASQTIELKKGWNLISVQTERGIDTSKATSCTITGGPYMYSGFIENGKAQGYVKRDNLNFGSGYWVKVADDCRLISEEEEEAPPAAPGESESETPSASSGSGSTIEPSGTRGRRFIADAG
ncbi:hypothetical protein HYW21_06930 [Candidatus Woesearchaeota archaeon]|nr:hypothetical protein [Candidatus Woesearchaeota archaeon]